MNPSFPARHPNLTAILSIPAAMIVYPLAVVLGLYAVWWVGVAVQDLVRWLPG